MGEKQNVPISVDNPRGATVHFLPFPQGETAPAGVAELVDALVSGTSGGNPVEVQVLSPAPTAALR